LQREFKCNGKFTCLFSGGGREVQKKSLLLYDFFITFLDILYLSFVSLDANQGKFDQLVIKIEALRFLFWKLKTHVWVLS